jgi:two-component system sensor histidine kinase KdpD
MPHPPTLRARLLAKWPLLAVWSVAWLLMLGLDGTVDLANLALLLVLAAALGGLWLSALESLAVCALAVLAFNWHFVPPRGTLTVDLRQHSLLLLAMLAVGSMVAWLMGRQRALAQAARSMAEHADLLRAFNDALRAQAPAAVLPTLAAALQSLTGAEVAIAWEGAAASVPNGRADTGAPVLAFGQANAEEWANLCECLRSATPAVLAVQDIHGYQAITLALRGQVRCQGAALLRFPAGHAPSADIQATAQALCDLTGVQRERSSVEDDVRRTKELAQAQQLRNTLLAAISHDYRTPLATILGAASALRAQSDRLAREQVQLLAERIVDEVEQLSTMTDNTLQLARLDAADVQLQTDWESLEELIGSAVARARQRYPGLRLNLRLEPDLPLLRCDAQLLLQLLNNLVDNAVKYGDPEQTVEVLARRLDQQLLLAVADRGPGIPAALRERMFLAFERGAPPTRGEGAQAGSRRGAGLGLALCRAIVTAHGGSIAACARQRGGTRIECRFPIAAQPAPDTPKPGDRA